MANVTIPELPLNNAPSTNTVLEIDDGGSGKATPGTLVPLGLEMANLVAFTDAAGALSVESSVADGVAFSLTPVNAAGGGLGIYSSGGIAVNRDWVEYWWGTPARGEVVIGSNADEGGSGSSFQAIHFNEAGTVDHNATFASSSIVLQIDGTEATRIHPSFGAETGAPSYVLDTTVEHTFGHLLEVRNSGDTIAAIGAVVTAGNTGLYLFDADNNTLQQVTLGANDSGGSGKRALVIPNAP